jgi:hypothetical protein
MHWANYIVSTKALRLTFRAISGPSDIVIHCDSSVHNAPEGRSYGGYALSHGVIGGAGPTYGAFAIKCLTRRE